MSSPSRQLSFPYPSHTDLQVSYLRSNTKENGWGRRHIGVIATVPQPNQQRLPAWAATCRLPTLPLSRSQILPFSTIPVPSLGYVSLLTHFPAPFPPHRPSFSLVNPERLILKYMPPEVDILIHI